MVSSHGKQRQAIYEHLPDMGSQSQFSDSQNTEEHDGQDSIDEKLTPQDHENVSFLRGEIPSQQQPTSLRRLACDRHVWLIGVGILSIFCLMFLVVLLSVCAMIQRTEARRMGHDGPIVGVDFVSWVSSAPGLELS
jgi:hypothetical protein